MLAKLGTGTANITEKKLKLSYLLSVSFRSKIFNSTETDRRRVLNDLLQVVYNGPLTRYVKLRVSHAPAMPSFPSPVTLNYGVLYFALSYLPCIQPLLEIQFRNIG